MNSAEYVKAVDDFATAGRAIGGLMEDCIADLATCEDKLKAAERERDAIRKEYTVAFIDQQIYVHRAEAAEARLTEMAREVRETLRPFAELPFDETEKGRHPESEIYAINRKSFTGNDILKARALLSKLTEGDV